MTGLKKWAILTDSPYLSYAYGDYTYLTIFTIRGTADINTTKLDNASIEWSSDDLPRSTQYGDIYSNVEAIAESQYVFIQGNALKERIQKIEKTDEKRFVIGECGFGFGLNFLLACECFIRFASPGSTLYYIAGELHPVLKRDLQRFIRLLPDTILPLANELLDTYPENGKTLHRITFNVSKCTIQLDLLYGDAASTFSSICQQKYQVDAWIMDGFSPDKNETMWNKKLCDSVAALSKPGTTFATYTSAGLVRRNLEEVGFHVTKSSGYGKKRHMLTGNFRQTPTVSKKSTWSFPWDSTSQASAEKHRKICIIGAGITGCATAHALARRGFAVDLIEKDAEIASGTSGNPRSLVHLNPAQQLNSTMRFRFNAYLYALRQYNSLSKIANFNWQPDGIIQPACSEKEQDAITTLWQRQLYAEAHVSSVNAKRISDLAGYISNYSGFYFPGAGSLDPVALCQAWARHKNIRLFTSHEVLDFQRKDNQWCVKIRGNEEEITAQYDSLILCNNMDVSSFSSLPDYPLAYNHGQADTYEIPENFKIPTKPLCNKGYLIPWMTAKKRMLTIGGCYAQGIHKLNSSKQLTQRNISLLEKLSPTLHKNITGAQLESISRIGTRLTTKDYQPLIGPVEDTLACKHLYSDLQRNARKTVQANPVYSPGLYINVGHGSNGLTTAPLAGEYLASIINDETLPLAQDEIVVVHPLRYLIRRLKKQEA